MIKGIAKKGTIRDKLVMINLATTGAAFLLAGAIFLVNEFYSFRASLLHDLDAQAAIIGSNSAAALVFNDRKAAGETLDALAASPNVVHAFIYADDGSVFAEYRRPGAKETHHITTPRSGGYVFSADHLDVFQRIVLDKKTIGTIHIRSDLGSLYALMLRHGAVAVVTIAIAICVAFLLLAKLQKIITGPILQLAQSMQAVSRNKDYSRRAAVENEDEIGSLAISFNEMLEQIQHRDTKLQVEVVERKRVEEGVRKLNEELEERVRERTKQLADAQQELVQKEKLAMLGLLAAGIGNELRNPLGVMNNALFYVQAIIPRADEKVTEHLEIIKSEIDIANRIITDLVMFCSTTAPVQRRISVDELLVQGLAQCSLGEKVTLLRDVPPNLPQVKVDPRQMDRVFRNLIMNAVQAMPEGGVLRLSAQSSAGNPACVSATVPGTAGQNGAFVEITIADTGAGIAPEDRERVFQPLFTTKARGIGLGLAIARNFVEANGGTVTVDNASGAGASFTVLLPAEP